MSKRVSLLDYCQIKAHYTRQPYHIIGHLIAVANAIELCIAGGLPNDKRNLILNLPPRWGKTTLVRNTMEWVLGQLPDTEWLYLSYTATLSHDQTKDIRRTLQSPWFQEMYPNCRLERGSEKQDHFRTVLGGAVLGAGFDVSITGFGAGKTREGFGGFIAIDDPIKPIEARRSEELRNKCIQNYNSTIKNRRNTPDTPMIVFMQRTHPDDLCGWLIKNEPDDWYVLRTQGYDEEKKRSRWEERTSTKDLENLKIVDEFAFYSQYQQIPRNPGGTIIREEWFYEYHDIERVKRLCNVFIIFADTAMKEKEANDYTVFQLWGFEGDKRAFLLDQVRGKWQFPDLVQAAKAFWHKHGYGQAQGLQGATAIFIEDKVSGTSLIQTLRRERLPVYEWVRLDYDVSADDKVSAARDASWMIFGGKCWLPSPTVAPWVDELVDEVTGFTEDMSHTFDDQVDTMVMALLWWKSYGGGVDHNKIRSAH